MIRTVKSHEARDKTHIRAKLPVRMTVYAIKHADGSYTAVLDFTSQTGEQLASHERQFSSMEQLLATLGIGADEAIWEYPELYRT